MKTDTHTQFWQRIAAERSYKLAALQAQNAALVAALEHIRFCYWSENEPMSERVDYLQSKAGEALAKAQTASSQPLQDDPTGNVTTQDELAALQSHLARARATSNQP